jgi:hypothetical protein
MENPEDLLMQMIQNDYDTLESPETEMSEEEKLIDSKDTKPKKKWKLA